MPWVYIWLGVVVLCLVIEFVTFELVSIWISVGAFVAMILALCGVSVEIQLVAAVVISVLCLVSLRKLAIKFLNRNKDKTNIDAMIGKKIKLITRTDEDELGSAKVSGVVWSVKEQNDGTIEKDEYAEVMAVDVNKLIVRKVKN